MNFIEKKGGIREMLYGAEKLSKEQVYLLKESLRNEYYRMYYHLESLSIDDYNNNGYNIENDIREMEDMMLKLDIWI